MADRSRPRRKLSVRGIDVPDAEHDFAAHPVELFFDLAFVFAFAQLVGKLIHDPTPSGVAESALLFLLLWLPWSQFTWTANATSAHGRPVQLVFLVATAASVPMAASISTAFGPGGPAFAVSLVVIYGMGLVLLVLGYDDESAEFGSAVRYAVPNVVSMVLLLAGGLVDDPVRTALWVAALLVFLFATIKAGEGDWVVRPAHFAERHGLIIIVALGEVIVAIATPVVAGLEEGAGVAGQTLVSLAAAGAFAGLLWFGYFDRPQRDFERRAAALPARERGRFARDVYTYIHAPITAGIILAAAALEEITLHPADVLPAEFRWMLFIGLTFYLGGIELAVSRAFRRQAIERMVAAVVVAAILLPPLDVSGLTLLIAVDVALLLMLVVEHLRLEREAALRTAEVAPATGIGPGPSGLSGVTDAAAIPSSDGTAGGA